MNDDTRIAATITAMQTWPQFKLEEALRSTVLWQAVAAQNEINKRKQLGVWK